MRRLVAVLSAAASLQALAQGAPPAAAPAPAQTAVLVGVVASENAESARQQADAFASFVARAVQEQTLGRVFPDQEALALALAKGEVDVGLLGPLGYVRLDPKANARLLFRTIRAGKGTYRSVLFAPANSKLKNLESLRQARSPLKVAWVETSSATGYVIPKALLLQAGINPAQAFEVQDFLGSHDAVCQAVQAGKYDVGATFSDPVKNAAIVTGCVSTLGRRADSLRVLQVSSDVPNDVVVASPKFAPGKADAIAALARSAKGSPDLDKALRDALHAEGVAEVKDEDFAPIRKALDAFVPAPSGR